MSIICNLKKDIKEYIKNAGYEGNDFHDLVMMNDDILVWRYQNLNNQYNNIVAILIPKQK